MLILRRISSCSAIIDTKNMDLTDINDRLETQLKNHFGIELDRLPKDTQNLLEELVDFQATMNLCDIDSNLVQEWYIKKRKESLDLRLKCFSIKSDIESVENLIASEEKLVQLYEKVLEAQKSIEEDASATEREAQKIQKDIELVKRKIKALNKDGAVDLRGLLEKIQTLNKDSVK